MSVEPMCTNACGHYLQHWHHAMFASHQWLAIHAHAIWSPLVLVHDHVNPHPISSSYFEKPEFQFVGHPVLAVLEDLQPLSQQ